MKNKFVGDFFCNLNRKCIGFDSSFLFHTELLRSCDVEMKFIELLLSDSTDRRSKKKLQRSEKMQSNLLNSGYSKNHWSTDRKREKNYN